MFQDEYFRWLLRKVDVNASQYGPLLSFLHSLDFYFSLPMDGCRHDDGLDLRYAFATSIGVRQAEIAASIDDRPCSVLEMLVALSLHVEEETFDIVMSDAYDAGYWFRLFLRNLGLGQSGNGYFDVDYVSSVIARFLNREYDRDGRGSIVQITDPNKDCREADIWMQVAWYLTENF